MQMGNCFGYGISATRVGDHGCCGDPTKASSSGLLNIGGDAEGKVFDDDRKAEEDGLSSNGTGVDGKDIAAVHVSSTDQLKIKVSKKQVVDLLGRVDLHGMSTHQILAHLILASGISSQHMSGNNQRSWRPILKSIPEVN